MDECLTDRPNPDESLLQAGWELRSAFFPPVLHCSAPSAKRYEIDEYRNDPMRFATISVTGRACELRCEHCAGRLLESMIAAPTPEGLIEIGQRLCEQGCRGVLISGGADRQGRVPLLGFTGALAALKSLGLQVIVHAGLLDRRGAESLKQAGVDQVLLDVIGDEETMRRVYHLDLTPADCARSLAYLKEAGLSIAPHIVIGLHFGDIRGEAEALRMITEAEADRIVMVVMTPLPGTAMRACPPPPTESVGRLIALARILNPQTPVALGCARPAASKAEVEALAIRAGVTAVAYPSQQSVDLARSVGLEVRFSELCCSLL